MIEARKLVKYYRHNAVLRGLSFRAAAGEVTLLIGANGAGKTTTLRILAGLTRPDSGAAFLGDRDVVSDRRGGQQQTSFLPQGIAFHPRLTCRQILQFYARLRGLPLIRAEEMLYAMGLETKANQPSGSLSGGLRQRLGIAVFLLPDAPVLLLDEPGLSLDPAWRGRLQTLLQSEAARGKCVLVTTHLLAEWEGIAHRCLVCQDGTVDRECDPKDLRSEIQSGKQAPATQLIS